MKLASGKLAPDVCCVGQMGQELLPPRGRREYLRVHEEAKVSSHSGVSGCSRSRQSATGYTLQHITPPSNEKE
jgi:hypothetical protein